MDPEYSLTGIATRESDVFGFGVVILEVVCGRNAYWNDDKGNRMDLTDWVWNLYMNGEILDAVDPRLKEYDRVEAKKLLLLGLACADPNAGDRPKTKKVLQVLMPAFVWRPTCEGPYENCTENTIDQHTHELF